LKIEFMPGEAATLDAVWIVRRMKDDNVEGGREVVQAHDYDARAGAHSRAIARLSQDIANAVHARAFRAIKRSPDSEGLE
jgi:hypothetical protein